MYEPISHARLNTLLDGLEPLPNARAFHTRLGANFYAIHGLFTDLYGDHPHFEAELARLVRVLRAAYAERSESLRALDAERERRPDWFLGEEWVAMALYTDGFAGDLRGFLEHLPYLRELGVGIVHLMPLLRCPPGASDGGYAVSDYYAIDQRVGTLDDLRTVAGELHERDMALVLDIVLNHTSDQHEWARRAREGDAEYQAYFHVFDDRRIPDLYEEGMPWIFPETAPGNFVRDEEMGKWVMSVFHHYQWDLNYANPAVFVSMLEIVLFWANQGADVLRLDAVAFIWKRIGTVCQNEREAHLILQLLKDCGQVVAPATLFIAEAIVAPSEIAKYFGEDAVVARECDIAYNATFMALLWDALATKNARVLNRGIRNLPSKLHGTTWLNYVRCHDDIGLGFDDADVRAVGYEPAAHRKFLLDYYTGAYEGSPARGRRFGHNDHTGDARISGTLASLAGLEAALESGEEAAVDLAVDRILLLHALIMSFGGIPLLYYGDEIGTLNDTTYLEDPDKAEDSRWLHRPRMDWESAARRESAGTIEHRIFEGIAQMIRVRRATPAFADRDDRELVSFGNEHLFGFIRSREERPGDDVLVVANFDEDAQLFHLDETGHAAAFASGRLVDLLRGAAVEVRDGHVSVPRCRVLWLAASQY